MEINYQLEMRDHMLTVIWMSVIFLLGFIVLFLFAACKVSSDADRQANYMEEYGLDFEEDIEENHD